MQSNKQELILKHGNSLKSNIFFELKNNEHLYEIIPNSEINDVYALITTTITSSNKKFNDIHIMYLLDLKSFLVLDISVSDTRFKSEDAKAMINRSELPEKSVIVTLNCSPFTTHIINEYFTKKNYSHIFYNKRHFTPIIDYTKNYFQGIVTIIMLNCKQIDDSKIRNLALT